MASPNLGSMLKRAGIWTILVVLTYVFWKWLAVYVLPFAIAVVIATLLDPMVRWLKQVGLSSATAIWMALGLGVVLTAVVLAVVSSLVAKELVRLTGRLPQYTQHWHLALDAWVQKAAQVRSTLGVSSSVLNAEFTSAVKLLDALLRQLLLAASGLPAGILVMVVAAVAVYFLLRDGRSIERSWALGFPEILQPRIKALEHEVMAGTLGFLKAQLVLVAITAATTMAGLALIGSHYAVVLGLAAGLLDLIPFLGPTALILPWAVMLIAMGDMLGAVKLLAVLVSVALTRQLVEPRLVSHQTGLHPLWVLFAFYVGIQLFGPIGFLVGPISAVMLRAVGHLLFDPTLVGE